MKEKAERIRYNNLTFEQVPATVVEGHRHVMDRVLSQPEKGYIEEVIDLAQRSISNLIETSGLTPERTFPDFHFNTNLPLNTAQINRTPVTYYFETHPNMYFNKNVVDLVFGESAYTPSKFFHGLKQREAIKGYVGVWIAHEYIHAVIAKIIGKYSDKKYLFKSGLRTDVFNNQDQQNPTLIKAYDITLDEAVVQFLATYSICKEMGYSLNEQRFTALSQISTYFKHAKVLNELYLNLEQHNKEDAQDFIKTLCESEFNGDKNIIIEFFNKRFGVKLTRTQVSNLEFENVTRHLT